MSRFWLRELVVGALLCSVSVWAQMPGFSQVQGEKVDGEVALDRALKTSSLTFSCCDGDWHSRDGLLGSG